MPTIAVVFDFDDTLVPDSTSALLTHFGIDAKDFWTRRAAALVAEGYDPPLAYLNLLLGEIGEGRPLGLLSLKDLREFGRTLDSSWFPGLPGMFDDLRDVVRPFRDVSVEFYIVSGGLQALIEGSQIVRDHFTGVYGCQLGEDESGVIRAIKRCVTFTEKTRFLFEINKGIEPADAATQPHLVNQEVPLEKRRIPLEHMIYVGDGLTDVPCFSLVEKNGGLAVGVIGNPDSAKQAFQSLLTTRRVRGLYSPDYTEGRDLGSFLRLAVQNVASTIELQRNSALPR